MTKRTLSAVAAASVLALLAACGGGGSGDTVAVNPGDSTNPSTPADDSSMVEAILTPSYAASSEEYAAYSFLNNERVRCGFGSLRQNAQLDQAARAHADWMIINRVLSHYESSSYPNGFTGYAPSDRAAFAGYATSYSVGEGLAFGIDGTKDGRGVAGVRELLAGVYHAIGALRPAKDVGISVRQGSDVNQSTLLVPTAIVTGTQNGYQTLDATEVVTYPCEGTSNAKPDLGLEDPNPVPGRNLSTRPLGPAITIMARVGNTLSLTGASMQRVSDGQSVTMRAPVTGNADPNGQLAYDPHIGYVLPDAPLEANTTYRVTLSGTNNGSPFQRMFTFTTGR